MLVRCNRVNSQCPEKRFPPLRRHQTGFFEACANLNISIINRIEAFEATLAAGHVECDSLSGQTVRAPPNDQIWPQILNGMTGAVVVYAREYKTVQKSTLQVGEVLPVGLPILTSHISLPRAFKRILREPAFGQERRQKRGFWLLVMIYR